MASWHRWGAEPRPLGGTVLAETLVLAGTCGGPQKTLLWRLLDGEGAQPGPRISSRNKVDSSRRGRCWQLLLVLAEATEDSSALLQRLPGGEACTVKTTDQLTQSGLILLALSVSTC